MAEADALRVAKNDAELARKSAAELVALGETLLNTSRWDDAERILLLAVERAEHEKSLEGQTDATWLLGRLCRERGDYPQAMTLSQQALGLAERHGDRVTQVVGK